MKWMWEQIEFKYPVRSGLDTERGRMGEESVMTKEKSCLILLFWILVPTLDQGTDLAMVVRLLKGPDPNTTINSCEQNLYKTKC